jgi:hypothetical protein
VLREQRLMSRIRNSPRADSVQEGPVNPADLDYTTVDRIVAAVDLDHGAIDRAGLLSDIQSCLSTYYAALERASDKPLRQQVNALKKAIATANRLREQIHACVIDTDFSLLDSECEWFVSRAQSRLSDLNMELTWGPDWEEALRLGEDTLTYSQRWRSRSPFEWIAGHYLPQAFAKHFSTQPRFHRRAKDRVPEGPVIRFVEQALLELGIRKRGKPYSREAIAKALTDCRAHRFRKRPRRSS